MFSVEGEDRVLILLERIALALERLTPPMEDEGELETVVDNDDAQPDLDTSIEDDEQKWMANRSKRIIDSTEDSY